MLVRADFNVPLRALSDGTMAVDDPYRINASLPTLRFLLDSGAHVTAASHLGRPKDDSFDPQFCMDPVRAVLDDLCPEVDLLENLRFSKGETCNDPTFVAALIDGFDAYVNEAFGVSHRAHASVIGPPATLPSAAGRELAHEIEVLGGLLHAPARPFVAIVGGAKVADKIGILQALASTVDVLAIGGAMAYTFLAASGVRVGDSLVDRSRLDECVALLGSGVEVVLPCDSLALRTGAPYGAGCDESDPPLTCTGDIPDGFVGLDIGPQSAARLNVALKGAATVLWNGPLGVVEDSRFASGTVTVARAVAACDGFTVVGGGDSVSAIEHLGLGSKISFLSTGGGAALEFMEYGDLPGLAALRSARNAPRGQR